MDLRAGVGSEFLKPDAMPHFHPLFTTSGELYVDHDSVATFFVLAEQ
jgi:hypothetical protein